ncbi:MAG TPA: NAD(P)H-binding protein [Steroidobacteraceae bacterium]|jgi:uncharacterized protein YbjT (DUF2867 family)
MADSEPRLALLAGASGLVGGYVLEALLDAPDFGRVFAVTRRPLGRESSRIANRIVQFDKLEAQLKGVTCHVAFCCLGTTLKEAGSEQAFRQVDFDYVLAFARAALAARVERFVVVSSVGANPQSKHFYLRVKGEMEAALEKMQFPALDIMQPGPLLAFRRPGEIAAALVMPLVNPLLTGAREGLRGISPRAVAAAMIGASRSGRRGVYRYTYPALRALAASKPVRVPPPTPKAQSGAR